MIRQHTKTATSSNYLDMLNDNNIAKSHSIRKQFQEIAQNHKDPDSQRATHHRPDSFVSREVFTKPSTSIIKSYHERSERRFRENLSPKRSSSKPVDPKASLADVHQNKILRNR